MSNLVSPSCGTANSGVSFRSNRDIAIHVPDLGLAEEFYGTALGFRVTGRSKNHLVFDTGAFRLYVNRDSTLRSFVPSFDVSDAAAARRRLEALGCTKASPGPESYFKDPFGFVFDIIDRN